MSEQYWEVTTNDGVVHEVTAITLTETETEHVFLLEGEHESRFLKNDVKKCVMVAFDSFFIK